MTTLFDVLSNGYKHKKQKSKQLGDYVMDESLSNHNHQTYYNPKDKNYYLMLQEHTIAKIG